MKRNLHFDEERMLQLFAPLFNITNFYEFRNEPNPTRTPSTGDLQTFC